MSNADVLIVGAGPTGLVLALWLSKLGARVRVIDKTAQPGTTSRALAVQARTLELYRQLDLSQTLVDAGHAVPAVNLWVQGEQRARLNFEEVGKDMTPYPFLHIFPQDEHEQLLIERLKRRGVEVERSTELVSYRDEATQIVAQLRNAAGGEEVCRTAYLAGCDGARSTVRQLMGTGFPGGTYDQIFYVADIEASGPAVNGELHVDLDRADFLAVFPLKGDGRVRLIGTVRGDRAAQADTLTFENVSARAIDNMKVQVGKLNWFSTYHVHHRVAEHFRIGRAFLLGDAAHIHSPVGGQGMNTGIGDAINLAWKLKAVLDGKASEPLLDSYETERIAFARRLVKTTDEVFTVATAQGRIADFIRTKIVPVVLPMAVRFSAWREWLFQTVSQVTINYRDSPMCGGSAGSIHGGDRLPWVKTGDHDNYTSLTAMTWQAHVYGQATPELITWCQSQRLPLHVFPWQEAYEKAGLEQDAVYLLRPDTYVAFADPSGAPSAVKSFLDDRSMTL